MKKIKYFAIAFLEVSISTVTTLSSIPYSRMFTGKKLWLTIAGRGSTALEQRVLNQWLPPLTGRKVPPSLVPSILCSSHKPVVYWWCHLVCNTSQLTWRANPRGPSPIKSGSQSMLLNQSHLQVLWQHHLIPLPRCGYNPLDPGNLAFLVLSHALPPLPGPIDSPPLSQHLVSLLNKLHISKRCGSRRSLQLGFRPDLGEGNPCDSRQKPNWHIAQVSRPYAFQKEACSPCIPALTTFSGL